MLMMMLTVLVVHQIMLVIAFVDWGHRRGWTAL